MAAAGSVAGAAAQGAAPGGRVKILGISCSSRKGMTTARAVKEALDEAKSIDPRIDVELIDLGGMSIAGWAKPMPVDEFTPLLEKFKDPAVGGLIIGSPSYYRGPSSLCRIFLERISPLRDPVMVLAGKPAGVVAVGGARNGGQEMVIANIQAALMCFGMLPAGGESPAFLGATLVSEKDDVSNDELGLDTARKLGARIAALALKGVAA
jgi:multimeric flavodoxin WrbA